MSSGPSRLEFLTQTLALALLQRGNRKNLQRHPQIAVLSFDTVSNCIVSQGRFEDLALTTLAERLFPHLAPGAALDVGANLGNHSLAFSPHFEQVFAFEPNPQLTPLLAYNAALAKNVTAFPFGASDKADTVYLKADPQILGAAAIVADGDIPIEVKPLDQVEELQATNIRFVKLDVEGHELWALKGMQELLQENRPVIAFEQLTDSIRDGSSDVIDFLEGLGYNQLYEVDFLTSRFESLLSLPKKFRHLIQLLEVGLLGLRTCGQIKPINELGSRDHRMMLASCQPLELS